MAQIEHTDITQFAADKVNLPASLAQTHRDQVNRLRDSLQKKIDADPDYGLVKMLHAGSVAKGTALKTVDDLDVGVYVTRADAPDDDPLLVPWLADRLYEAAPSNMTRDQFEEQAHCVTVNYKGSGLSVDVVPVLYEGEADDVGYLIDHTTGDRLLTSISLHLRFIRSRKKKHGQNFAELIRLTKWWRRQARNQDFPDLKFKSFMIELLWAHLADTGLDLSDYPTALEGFFEYAVRTELDELVTFEDFCDTAELPSRGTAPIEVIDPVNPANNVAVRYGAVDKDLIVTACGAAFDALCEARFATTKTRAVDCWQTVLGASFRG